MYAKYTSVPVEKSIEEIRSALAKIGAKGFSYGSFEGTAFITFMYNNTPVKIFFETAKTPGPESGNAEIKKFEQSRRTQWRQILLCIKAKLECVQCGIETFEQAFMPHIILKDGELLGAKVFKDFGTMMKKEKAAEALGFKAVKSKLA